MGQLKQEKCDFCDEPRYVFIGSRTKPMANFCFDHDRKYQKASMKRRDRMLQQAMLKRWPTTVKKIKAHSMYGEMKKPPRDYETDKLIMDLFTSLTKKEQKKFVEGLSKKEKKQILAMILTRAGWVKS